MQLWVLMVGQAGSQAATACHTPAQAWTALSPPQCTVTPMNTLPQPRRPGLIQKGSWRGKGKEMHRQTCQREQRELWLEEECGPAQPRGPVLIHSQSLQHKAGLRDIAVPCIFYVIAVWCEGAIKSDTWENMWQKNQTTPHIHTPNQNCISL